MTAALCTESSPPSSSSVEEQLASVMRLVEIADRFGDEPVPDVLGTRIRLLFAELVRAFDDDVRTMRDAEIAAFAGSVQTAMMPLVQRAENGRRWYEKPRGFAGDFGTIARIYDDEARGESEVDRILDRCFLDLPAVFAVQNRRAVLASQIRATIRACAERGPARVTSLACGPAREVFDMFARLDDERVLEATLVDSDREALAYCGAERTARTLDEQIELIDANLVQIAHGRSALWLPPQDLVFSGGLIDYLEDRAVVKLLDWIHGMLAPGGRVILGAFHKRNPTRAMMDHVLDWRLVHRDEVDMNRIARASAFGKPCSRFLYEPQNINLFAEIVK
jgi:SAM-dependent methyltransferase